MDPLRGNIPLIGVRFGALSAPLNTPLHSAQSWQLGMETQRQWNDQAIARTTPALVSLYSIITLTAHLLLEKGATGVRSTAGYDKTRPTFSDALAWVRRQLWDHIHFSMSQQETDMIKIPRALLERFTEALCYAA